MFLFWLAVLISRPVFSEPDIQEYGYKVKAVYMYNFTRYLSWPGEAKESPFTIGVLGECPIVEPLLEIAEKRKVHERPIKVLQFKDADHMTDVQMLFIPYDKSDLWPSLQRRLEGVPTITIGERAGLAEDRVSINFVRSGDTIRFEINEQVIRGMEILPSSQLLNLALRIVE